MLLSVSQHAVTVVLYATATMEWGEPRQIPDFGRCAHCTALVPTTAAAGGVGEGGGAGAAGKAVDVADGNNANNIALICGGFDGATTIFDDMKLLDLGVCVWCGWGGGVIFLPNLIFILSLFAADTCSWKTSTPSPRCFGTRFAHAMTSTPACSAEDGTQHDDSSQSNSSQTASGTEDDDQKLYVFGGMSPMSDLSDMIAIKVRCS